MNRNPKEKLERIEIRARPQEKQRIQSIARRCGLSVSEYMVKRALGQEPRAVLPDAFYDFYRELCKLSNSEHSPGTENKLLSLIDEIHSELLLPGREDVTTWQQPDSGPSKAD